MRLFSRTVRWLALAGVVSAVGGCGPAFDKNFDAGWDKKMRDTCVPSAVKSGAPPAMAEAYCTCVVTQLDKLTVQQKMALNPSTSPEAQAAVATCAARARSQTSQ